MPRVTGEALPLGAAVAVLLACAGVLIVAGARFALVVDRLADRLGIGEALAGAVLLGATTSLPGLVVTTWTAAQGRADLAVSNSLGGIAAQTMFLALADLSYRHANLEHAAASLPNLLQTMVLISLVSLVLLAWSGPPVDWLGVHPVSLALPACYLYGLHLTRGARRAPMWRPRRTAATRPDVPDTAAQRAPLGRLWASFAWLALLVAGCGFAVAVSAVAIASQTGLSDSLVGGLLTSVVTSMPELVTVLAAVRAGALTLAVGDIIGGNTFDVLFIAAADVAYGAGSIYAVLGAQTVFLLALTLLLTGIFAAGMLCRQERGIGFEGGAILVVYAVGFAVLAGMG